MYANHHPFCVLLIEDHYPDIVLISKAFREVCGQQLHLHSIRDGEEALCMLRKEHPLEGCCKPDLILLDINLPRRSGYEVLQEVKQQAALMHIPVLILTSSQSEQDIAKSYRLHANSYLVKPSCFSEYLDMVRYIKGFWLQTARLIR